MAQVLPNQELLQSTRTLLVGIWGHLSRRRRLQLCFLLVVMLASGVAELISLGAVLPFLAVLSNPELLWQKPLIQTMAAGVGITAARDLLLPATLAFAAAAVLAALIRLANLWLNGRLAAAVGSDLSCEAYRRTLYQPYSVHMQRNSAALITTSTTHINRTVAALNALLQLITAIVVVLALLTGLLLIDLVVALAAVAIFGSAYGLMVITTRKKLLRNSKLISLAASQQIKSLQEGLGAIRDVLLDCNQQNYVEIYRKADRPQRILQAKNVFLIDFPRFPLDALGLVTVAIIGGILVLQQKSGNGVIPLLGAIALGAQRLLPNLQQIYRSWSSLNGFNSDMAGVLALLDQPLPKHVKVVVSPLPLHQAIRLEGVHFCYGSKEPEVIRGLNLEIRSGERIGLIGSTGSGKSTLVDLLMGLLNPTQGRILVDGVDLHDPAHPERLAAWRSTIAHVPQNIYLADTSIAQNIAFGVPKGKIDIERVKKAAEQAQISSFIESIPEKYHSFVGERGICLSGGQRQRIGIARALYKQARLIVFDEATSALDTDTEDAVMAAVEELSEELTIVMIAHRLTTLAQSDRVVRLDQGSIVASGPPSLILTANT